jgi:RNA polymerase sigma-70 factor (ECF subfamily)
LSTGATGAGQYGVVTSSVARLPIAASLERVERVERVEGVEREGLRSSAALRAAPPIAVAAVSLPVFELVYEEQFDFVWRTARRLGVPESAADDVVQDTFLVLHRRLAEYDGQTPIRRWLAGILTRVVADHRRRHRRKDAACVPHPEESERALPSNAPAPSAEAEQSEAVRLLDALLAELDEDKREVLVLAQLEEMTVPEIAELLGANVNTVYARLRAARREFDAAYARHRAKTEHGARGERRLP